MAAPRLTQNPHLEGIPDHAGPHYIVVHTALVNSGMTEEAVQSLNTSWTLVHNERIQIWDQQVIDDAQAQEDERRIIQEQEDQQRVQKEQDLESERQEAEKKKLKMNSFSKDSMVHDFLTPRPSAYALRCLEEFEYVESWYFTQEGCMDASQNQRTQNEDTFCWIYPSLLFIFLYGND